LTIGRIVDRTNNQLYTVGGVRICGRLSVLYRLASMYRDDEKLICKYALLFNHRVGLSLYNLYARKHRTLKRLKTAKPKYVKRVSQLASSYVDKDVVVNLFTEACNISFQVWHFRYLHSRF